MRGLLRLRRVDATSTYFYFLLSKGDSIGLWERDPRARAAIGLYSMERRT